MWYSLHRIGGLHGQVRGGGVMWYKVHAYTVHRISDMHRQVQGCVDALLSVTLTIADRFSFA